MDDESSMDFDDSSGRLASPFSSAARRLGRLIDGKEDVDEQIQSRACLVDYRSGPSPGGRDFLYNSGKNQDRADRHRASGRTYHSLFALSGSASGSDGRGSDAYRARKAPLGLILRGSQTWQNDAMLPHPAGS